MIEVREALTRPPGSGRYSVFRFGADRIPGEPQHIEVDADSAFALLARPDSVWIGSPTRKPAPPPEL